MVERITRAQVTKIWALANSLGLNRDLLYLMVPRGSISSLSRLEASELIEKLSNLSGRQEKSEPVTSPVPDSLPVDPNAATNEQKAFIHFLLGRLGWIGQPARVRGFLHKFAHVDSVETIPDRKRASAIIEALKAIHRRQRQTTAGTTDKH